ncbi:MAG: pectic acid lyase [Planctomycetaceae bacterium]|nr:pectic acid lyase [Planctomycetaceae bacterium]
MIASGWRLGRMVVGLTVVAAFAGLPVSAADDDLAKEAREAMTKAVQFYSQVVASHGGYVYKYSADLSLREGEGRTTPDTLWIQPPGTPTVGLAYTEAYLRTKDESCLAAARAAADCVLQGQLQSGCWTDSVSFEPDRRAKTAYLSDGNVKKKRPFNVSTFDDDKTQSALRFLMRLDTALDRKDQKLHKAVETALEAVLTAQLPNGAWAQGFDGQPHHPPGLTLKPATLTSDWPRKYPGGDYWWYPTLNDNAMADTIEMLLLAARLYKEPRYHKAAIRGAEFLLAAQLPEPQPAWAQQYNFETQPCWARKFEPAAVSGSESQGVIVALMMLYAETGEDRFLAPIPKALDYLERSTRADGRLPRFLEMETNRPLYMTKDYQLTDRDDDLPTHYGFIVDSKVPQLRKQLEKLKGLNDQERKRQADTIFAIRAGSPKPDVVREVIAKLDSRGAWVETGELKYHRKTAPIIESATFAKNLEILSQFVASKR